MLFFCGLIILMYFVFIGFIVWALLRIYQGDR